jgi:hypothetical protein
MSFDAEQTLYYNVANAAVRAYPFPHFYVENVFPADFYATLLENLPPQSAYRRLDETGTVPKGAYPDRYICSLEEAEEDEFRRGTGDFWERFHAWMRGDTLVRLLLDRFRDAMLARYGDDVDVHVSNEARLVRDYTHYDISPHTDTPRKLVSLLFYLPADDSMRHLGTSLYVPRDPARRCEGTKHHDFSDFLKVGTAEFRPNSLLAFFKTDLAFHGVEPITDAGIERNLLLYNLYAERVVPKAGRSVAKDWSVRPAPAWTWRTPAARA